MSKNMFTYLYLSKQIVFHCCVLLNYECFNLDNVFIDFQGRYYRSSYVLNLSFCFSMALLDNAISVKQRMHSFYQLLVKF